jgi:3-hydroxyacyl-CoA dehydrogenase
MENVLVIGAGYMGSGIAQVCAQAGYQVHLVDVKPEALDKGMEQIKWSLGKLESKKLLKDSAQTVFQRITPEKSLSSAASADWVIEVILEIEELKKQLFKELDHLASPKTPLATNTSTIPITRLAQATQHPERVLGLHFFGPVPLMGAVEVIKGTKTSGDIFERGVAFVRSLGKTPIRVNKDIPGFILNRVFGAAVREAMELVTAGVSTPEDIDTGMKLGFNWNAGPFEIVDNAGLDVWAFAAKSMEALGEKHIMPPAKLIEQMLKEGRIGRKVGKGFYRYTADGKRLPWQNDKTGT